MAFPRVVGTPRNARSADINDVAAALDGEAGKGLAITPTDFTSSSLYALVVGNQDATNGLAAQFQYGPAATPTTIATFAKAGVTFAVPFTPAGEFYAAGVVSGGEGGLLVQDDGKVGMLDAAVAGVTNPANMVLITKTTDENCILFDTILNSTYPGIQVFTGTATSGAASTLTLVGAGWTVNAYSGKVVHLISGTGSSSADPYRGISSNTATVLTVGAAWTVTPDATTVFEIITVGDQGAGRFVGRANGGQVGAMRALEAHGVRRIGSAAVGCWGLEVGSHTCVTSTDENSNVGIYLYSGSQWNEPGDAVQANTALWIGGDPGYDAAIRAYSVAGAKVIELEGQAGHARFAGLGTFGQIAAGTAGLTVKQATSNDHNRGIRVLRFDDTDGIAMFAGGDDNGYVQALAGGIPGSFLVVGGPTNGTALTVSGTTSHSGLLLQCQDVNSVAKMTVANNGAVNSAVSYSVAGVKLLGVQGAAVADATDAPSVILRLNEALARLRAHGVIAT